MKGIDIELDAADTDRVAGDREAEERLLLRLANTLREFGYVDSGREVRLGTLHASVMGRGRQRAAGPASGRFSASFSFRPTSYLSMS